MTGGTCTRQLPFLWPWNRGLFLDTFTLVPSKVRKAIYEWRSDCTLYRDRSRHVQDSLLKIPQELSIGAFQWKPVHWLICTWPRLACLVQPVSFDITSQHKVTYGPWCQYSITCFFRYTTGKYTIILTCGVPRPFGALRNGYFFMTACNTYIVISGWIAFVT